MLGNEAIAATATQILVPKSAADTAAATSAWIAVPEVDGHVVFTLSVGAVTGSMASKMRHSAAADGSNPADVTGGGFTTVSDANHVERIAVLRNALKGYVQFVGTVTTGPILLSVTMVGRNKYV